MVNLYSIYDTESKSFIGEKMTASEISDLIGTKINNVYPSATSNQLLEGRYRVKITGIGKPKRINMDAETMRVMEEWEEVTEKLRRYFQKARRSIGRC